MDMKKTLGIAVAAILLALGAGCATESGGQSTTARVVDDSVITGKVKTYLIEDQALKAFQINVDTYNGQVLLSGFVNTSQEAQRAVEVAKNVEGVKSVRSALVLKSATGKPSGGAASSSTPSKSESKPEKQSQ